MLFSSCRGCVRVPLLLLMLSGRLSQVHVCCQWAYA
jgi:hypothetical protein